MYSPCIDLDSCLLRYHLLVKPFSGKVTLSSADSRSDLLLSKHESGIDFDFDFGTFGDTGQCEFSSAYLHGFFEGQIPSEIQEALEHERAARLIFHKDGGVSVCWEYTEEEFDQHIEELIFKTITQDAHYVEVETVGDLVTAYGWAPEEVMAIASEELSEILNSDLDKNDAEDILKSLQENTYSRLG